MLPAILKRSILMWALVLSACTIQLVPSYDQALVEGVDAANTEALTLFAALESEPSTAKFSDYEERYSELIGTFEALQQRASNRQIPPLAKRLATHKIVRDFCNSASDPYSCLNVTPSSLGVVLDQLRKMRDRHRANRLAADTVPLFRNNYNIAIAQVLTVENALKR